MADVVDALQFLVEPGLVVEVGRLPVQRMSGGGLEAPFANGHFE